MTTQTKVIRMMYSGMLMQALEEFQNANDVEKSVNGSLKAAIMERQIRETRNSVEMLIKSAEEFNYPDVTLVSINDSDRAVMELAIVDFAWNVMCNFGPDQHFRIQVDAFVKEWSEMEWKDYKRENG